MSTSPTSRVFHRNILREYPRAVSGDDVHVVDSEGRRYLDGAGGVFCAILGHGPKEVADAVVAEIRSLNFAYTGDFATSAEERLAAKLIELAPKGFSKVWLTTSGSTANEAALKLARQYHVLRGQYQKSKVIARWHSYHGSTMGALSMTGTPPRRRLYTPYLLDFPHVAPPNCYRCALGRDALTCAAACAAEIEREIRLAGPEYVSAVIVEPVAGGPLGALVSSPEYLRAVRRICDENDVLMIVDEVVSGVGRTGDWFAIDQSGVVPDLITLGKGLGGGYVPIGAMIVRGSVYSAFEAAKTSFLHGESFTGHNVVAAAGYAVLDFIERHDLLANVRSSGARLEERLCAFSNLPIVGMVRGRGLLFGVELVKDKHTKEPFPRALQISERVVHATAERGVLLLAGQAGADGVNGDTILIAPPYTVTTNQIDLIVDTLADALRGISSDIGK